MPITSRIFSSLGPASCSCGPMSCSKELFEASSNSRRALCVELVDVCALVVALEPRRADDDCALVVALELGLAVSACALEEAVEVHEGACDFVKHLIK